MTEDEAKTKWCPFTRDFKSGTLTPACNRADGKPAKFSMCVGSACMAWRFETVGYLKNKETGFSRPAKVGEAYSPLAEEYIEGKGTTGYCGLAGKP